MWDKEVRVPEQPELRRLFSTEIYVSMLSGFLKRRRRTAPARPRSTCNNLLDVLDCGNALAGKRPGPKFLFRI